MMVTENTSRTTEHAEKWPELPYADWKDTCETLHMWEQVIGKVRLTLSPYANQWWQVPYYVTARGLTTSAIPYAQGIFEIHFDFIDHQLLILTSENQTHSFALTARPVADFYHIVMDALHALGIEVQIHTRPNEVVDPIRFEDDYYHASYDPVYVNRFWHVLVQTEKVLRCHRAQFIGKSSPIQFFWGSNDLALTFFSGRRAPERPGADRITREAYSHEVISCGFWPGSPQYPHPAFYAYAAPVPTGLESATIRPSSAYYDTNIGEFLLHYDDVRRSSAPEKMLLDFYQTTYEASANLGHWDRDALEKHDREVVM
jgi:Family of unknown function (DUF5996)